MGIVKDTTICHSGIAMNVAQRSTLRLKNNHISCPLAISSESTTTVSAHENVFATTFLIKLSNNVGGKVEFTRNRMADGYKARYALDGNSVKIDDDFEELQIG